MQVTERLPSWSYTKVSIYTFVSFLILLIFVIVNCTLLGSPIIALAGLIALAVGWCFLTRPWLLLAFTLAGCGIPSIVIPFPGHAIHPAELGVLLCVAIILFLRPRIRLRIPHVLALIFLGLAVVSFIHVPEMSTSAVMYGANKRLYNLILILLPFFCGTWLFRTVKDMSLLFTCVVCSHLPLFLICFAQSQGIPLPPMLSPNQDPGASGDAGRLVGPFDGAATFGIYVAVFYAVTLACWLLGSKPWHRRIGGIFALLSLITIFGSGTRSALLAGVLCTLIALVMTKRYKLVISGLVLTLLGVTAFFNSVVEHFTHADTSTSNRLFLWAEAWKLIKMNPVFGIGMEQFHHYYNRLIISQSTQLNQNGISVHNQYLEIAMEGGVLWFLSMIVLFVSMIVLCARAYPKTQTQQRLPMFATILATIAVMIVSFLDVPINSVETGVLLFLLGGLALGRME